MVHHCDFDGLVYCLQSGRRITIETISVGQVSKDTGFVF